MAKNNGQIWKIIGVLTTLGVLAVSVVYGYATLTAQVNSNCAEIETIKPVVSSNHDAKIGFEKDIASIKKDIAQMLIAQEKMAKTEAENTKAIIEAIGRINNGN